MLGGGGATDITFREMCLKVGNLFLGYLQGSYCKWGSPFYWPKNRDRLAGFSAVQDRGYYEKAEVLRTSYSMKSGIIRIAGWRHLSIHMCLPCAVSCTEYLYRCCRKHVLGTVTLGIEQKGQPHAVKSLSHLVGSRHSGGECGVGTFETQNPII